MRPAATIFVLNNECQNGSVVSKLVELFSLDSDLLKIWTKHSVALEPVVFSWIQNSFVSRFTDKAILVYERHRFPRLTKP